MAFSGEAAVRDVHKSELTVSVARLQILNLSHAQRALAVVVQRQRGWGSLGLGHGVPRLAQRYRANR